MLEKADTSRFWDRFIDLARQADVPERALRWYVRRVEEYIQAHPGKRLRAHGPSDVKEYLLQAGRSGNLHGWQFGQLVHALQLLFTGLVRTEWTDTFDWRYWLDSARELEAKHPTVARHNQPIDPTGATASAEKDFPYPDILHNVAAEIRRRNYSIRTEHRLGTPLRLVSCQSRSA